MSSVMPDTYKPIQKKAEMATKTNTPNRTHQNALTMGLPPRRGKPPVAVVIDAVPDKQDDEDQNRATSYASGDKVVKMEAHQHESDLLKG